MSTCSQYGLAEATELFMNAKGITKKKNFDQWLVIARFVWKDIFKNTLFETKSEWKTMQRGDPFNYVLVPEDAERIFSVSVEDDCHNIVPLFYNNGLSIVKKPVKKKCGCTTCDCGGLCSDAYAVSLTVTTRLVFTINGVNYYEKTWLQVCKNGDIIEWKSTPVKKYNNIEGDAGDYDPLDYNNDWLIGNPPFSDFTIVYVESPRKICHLEVLPCGCVAETEDNIETFNQACGCFLDCCSVSKKKYCDDFLANPNDNDRGSVKLSSCGTKIYYQPSKRWRQSGNDPKKIPAFLLINYQTCGETCTQNTMVPEYALDCMFMGMNWHGKRVKDGVPYNEKLASKWQYEDARNGLILYLNPLSLSNLADIQDAVIRW